MERKRIIHPYTITRLDSLEKWLSKKAEQGLELVEVKGWIFVFKSVPPQEYRYVVHYDVPGGIGRNQELYEKFKRLYSKYSVNRGKKARRGPFDEYLEFFITTELDRKSIRVYKAERARDYRKKSLFALIVFLLLSVVLFVLLCVEDALLSKAGLFCFIISALPVGYFGFSYFSNK